MQWNKIKHGAIRLKPADIILVRSPGLFGKLIRWATRHRGEDASKVNHVCMVERNTGIFLGRYTYPIIDTMITVFRRSLYNYDNPFYEVLIVRDKTLKDQDRLLITTEARKYIGTIYSPLTIVAHLFDKILGKILGREVVILSQIELKGVICNEVVSKAYSKVCRHFDRPNNSADPDFIFDYVTKHPEKYSIIFISDGLEQMQEHPILGEIEVNYG